MYYGVKKMTNKKKKINEGIRGIAQNLIKEEEIEKNLKMEIAKELDSKNKKSK